LALAGDSTITSFMEKPQEWDGTGRAEQGPNPSEVAINGGGQGRLSNGG
jgi:hypothetical protein